ncbi:MAG: TonB-dependent receptor plug domain-containing protein [Polaribacter sp.]
MNKQLCIVIGFVCLFVSKNISAQEKVEALEEIVITATKFPIKKEHIGKVIYKITQKQIVNNAGKTVIELLNTIPGIEIKGSNTTASEPRSTYVRGGRSRQVLVLIDGVPVSDPSLINQEFDLRLLSLNQVQSIEVLKGASSTIYGSGAATGVINITLKKALKDTIAISYQASIGTNNDAKPSSSQLSEKQQNGNINGNLGNFNFLTSFSITSKNGMSSAKSNTNQVFENDPYYSKNGMLKLGYTFNKKMNISSFLNFDEFEYDYDAAIYEDSNINNGEQSQIRFGIKPRFVYNLGEVYLLASFNDVKRTDSNFSPFSNTTNISVFKGQSINVDLVNRYHYSKRIQFITGINYQNHSNNSTTPFGNIDKKLAHFNTIDPYISAMYISENGFTANLGGRLNIHSNYGNHFVYDANVSHQFIKNKELIIRGLASYSTAFIAPSTYQLFSVYGDTNLNPETSKTLEIGFDSSYKKWFTFDAVYFNRVENDAIIFTNLATAPFGLYANSTETVKVSGVETEIFLKPADKIALNFGYTYIDKSVDVEYIPKHKWVANVEFYPTKKSFVSLVYKNVGNRFANYFDSATFATVETTLPNYDLLDLNANYTLLEGTVTLFGSITNIFNKDYEDILGYETRGRNFKFGIRLRF